MAEPKKGRGYATLECRRRYNSRAHERLAELKKGVPCMDCGGVFPTVCMDFDHRPGETKLFNISSNAGVRRDRLLAEVAKCDIVCANCHRIRTHARREYMPTPPPKKRGGQLRDPLLYRCGHPRTPENTYKVKSHTYGNCKECTKAKARKYHG